MNKNNKKLLAGTEVVTTDTPHGNHAEGEETKLRATWLPIHKLQKWEKNPRYIKDQDFEKLKKSLAKNPEFAQKRPLLVNHTKDKKGQDVFTVYAGNMRLSAMKALGWPLAPCIVEKDIPKKRMEEEALKDNIEYGQWDMDILADQFEMEDLLEMDLPEKELGMFELSENDLADGMNLSDEEKGNFTQKTFTLSTQQAMIIEAAMDTVMTMEEYADMNTYGNENKNGNALALIVDLWAKQNK